MVYKSQVRKSNEQEVFLYHGKDAVDVRMEGLEIEPVYYADATKDWSDILNLISKKQYAITRIILWRYQMKFLVDWKEGF